MENMYDSYTCDGINQIYFCLKHGFEDIKHVVGENSPLDEYGLSMLSIIVNEDGELAYCTTRWNHDNGGNDSAMDAVEISKAVNANFYEVFKPNTKWKDMVNNAKQRLANGESPKEIFDYVDEFIEGYAKVELNDKWNCINKNGEIISDKWFDSVDNFKNGYAKVGLNDKLNFINKNGEIISDTWFDGAFDFKEGNDIESYSLVTLNDKWNCINKNGEIISDTWFDWVYDFREGYAKVRLNGDYNFINKNGEIISDTWFDGADTFSDGYAIVKIIKIKNEKFKSEWNFINKNGEYLSDKWFYSYDDANEYLDNVLKK
jgi:hypothetical protein